MISGKPEASVRMAIPATHAAKSGSVSDAFDDGYAEVNGQRLHYVTSGKRRRPDDAVHPRRPQLLVLLGGPARGVRQGPLRRGARHAGVQPLLETGGDRAVQAQVSGGGRPSARRETQQRQEVYPCRPRLGRTHLLCIRDVSPGTGGQADRLQRAASVPLRARTERKPLAAVLQQLHALHQRIRPRRRTEVPRDGAAGRGCQTVRDGLGGRPGGARALLGG